MNDVIRTSNANDDTWENNAKYLLERCPHTVRVREGGGPENLMHSFIHTFMAMEQKLRGSHETLPISPGVLYMPCERHKSRTFSMTVSTPANPMTVVCPGCEADAHAQKATEPHRAPDPRHCPQCGPHPTQSSAEHARAAHTVAGVLADSNREVTAELIQHIVTASETNEALLLGPQSVHNLRWVLNDVLAAAGAPPA